MRGRPENSSRNSKHQKAVHGAVDGSTRSSGKITAVLELLKSRVVFRANPFHFFKRSPNPIGGAFQISLQAVVTAVAFAENHAVQQPHQGAFDDAVGQLSHGRPSSA